MLIGSLSNLNAGTIDPRINDSKYLEYGSKHKCVVQIGGKFKHKDGKELNFLGSAVIIRPRIAITAAHVLNESTESHIIFNDKKIKILGFIIPSNYVHDSLSNLDIALCYLEEEIILDFYPELYSDRNEIGKICSISGFGQSGTHATGANKYDQKRRAGSNIIDGVFEGMLLTSLKNGKKTSLEFLIANGDSGGGLFIDQKLAGIHSCIMSEDKKLDSNINDEALHTRISSHKVWIEEIIKQLENDQPAKLNKKSINFM